MIDVILYFINLYARNRPGRLRFLGILRPRAEPIGIHVSQRRYKLWDDRYQMEIHYAQRLFDGPDRHNARIQFGGGG